MEQREPVGQFNTTYEKEHETVPQFIIRFQTLHRQLTSAPLEDEAKAVYLAALRESLRTMCVVVDFRTNTIDQVVDRVLEKDKNNTLMSMGALQQALPKEEDLRFCQAMQCTTCRNPGHSTLECTMRTCCMLYHSRSHSMDRCEYNFLNRQATTVRHIRPRNEQRLEEKWFWREE